MADVEEQINAIESQIEELQDNIADLKNQLSALEEELAQERSREPRREWKCTELSDDALILRHKIGVARRDERAALEKLAKMAVDKLADA